MIHSFGDGSLIAWIDTCLQDIRYGFRQLRRSPVLLIVAVLSLALGIGANTAIFTLIKAVLLQVKIPLLAGRTIEARDTAAAGSIAVVNQTFVNEYFLELNPVGQRMAHGDPFKAPGSKIAGVVSDSKFFDLREKPKPMFFIPWPRRRITVLNWCCALRRTRTGWRWKCEAH